MIKIYTDGGCQKNPGPGAWAFSIFDEGKSHYERSGFVPATTNNQMELTAILEAMIYVFKNNIVEPVVIHSDSLYSINSITKWVDGWVRRGWRDVKNVDLMQALLMMRNALPNVSFVHVRGHSGVDGNNFVDRLCTTTMQSFERQKRKAERDKKKSKKKNSKTKSFYKKDK